MNDLLEELKLLIIGECEPQSLSNLSLVDKKYYDLLHGNSVLMLLSIRYDFKFESFTEYQLFCEIKYLVPQASKHYDMKCYHRNISNYLSLPSIDEMIEKLNESDVLSCDDFDNSINLIYKYLYEHEAHITGNFNPDDSKIKEIKRLAEIIDINASEYLRYLIRQCPNSNILVQYWDKYRDMIIPNNDMATDELFCELFCECISSIYCIERLHWIHSINLTRSYERFNELEEFHPYIMNYMVIHLTSEKIFDIFEDIDNEEFTIDQLIKIGNNYKYGERVNKIMEKMEW